MVDAPGGGGKISLQPNYIISQSPSKTVLRNFEGVITTYPEAENYTPGRADGFFAGVYPDYMQKSSDSGIAGLMNDKQFNLVPEGLKRMDKRKDYTSDPIHTTLKDQREKRDSLKEKNIWHSKKQLQPKELKTEKGE